MSADEHERLKRRDRRDLAVEALPNADLDAVRRTEPPAEVAGYDHKPECPDLRLPRVESHGFRFYVSSGHRCSNGSITATPAFSKSTRFRVAMVSPCTRAVAAIGLSLIGIARSDARRPAISSAQRRPVAASHGKQCSRPTPSANQRSSRVRRPPSDRRRIPNLISPRMMGSTTSSRSFFPKPSDDLRVRGRLRGFAQNICVNQEGHNVSVLSDSIGTKKPFSGQLDSQSTTPSCGLGVRRISRYVPRSMRSTSNTWPGSTSSCRRISAGSRICPFVETETFTEAKIPPCFCKHQRRCRMEDGELPGFARAVRGRRTSETTDRFALGNMPD